MCRMYEASLRDAEGKPLDAKTNAVASTRNLELLAKVRAEKLAGVRSAECAKCWAAEAASDRSLRQAETRRSAWSFTQADAVRITDARGHIPADTPVLSWDIRLGNEVSDPELTDEPWAPESAWQEDAAFWEAIERATVPGARFRLSGREPMLIDGHYDFLEKCIATGRSGSIELEYETAGTVLPARVVDLWRRFKRVDLQFRVDGVGKVGEYLRCGSRWDAVEANILEAAKIGDPIRIAMRPNVSLLNILYLPDIAEWAIEHGLADVGPRGRLLTGHEELALQVLPRRAKDGVMERHARFQQRHASSISRSPVLQYVSAGYQRYLAHMNAADQSSRLPALWAMIEKLDARRQTSIHDALPELCELASKPASRTARSRGFDLSVVVSVSATTTHLRECLTSLLLQTDCRLEVLVLDCGAAPATLDVARATFAAHSFDDFTISSADAGARGAARRTAIARAKGDYLAFIDGDDFAGRDAFRTLLEAGQGLDCDMVLGRAVTVEADGNGLAFVDPKPWTDLLGAGGLRITDADDAPLVLRLDPRLDGRIIRRDLALGTIGASADAPDVVAHLLASLRSRRIVLVKHVCIYRRRGPAPRDASASSAIRAGESLLEAVSQLALPERSGRVVAERIEDLLFCGGIDVPRDERAAYFERAFAVYERVPPAWRLAVAEEVKDEWHRRHRIDAWRRRDASALAEFASGAQAWPSTLLRQGLRARTLAPLRTVAAQMTSRSAQGTKTTFPASVPFSAYSTRLRGGVADAVLLIGAPTTKLACAVVDDNRGRTFIHFDAQSTESTVGAQLGLGAKVERCRSAREVARRLATSRAGASVVWVNATEVSPRELDACLALVPSAAVICEVPDTEEVKARCYRLLRRRSAAFELFHTSESYPWLVGARSDAPEISIIVPLRTERQDIGRTVGSLLQQTLESIEILLVHDRDDRVSAQGASAWAARDDRVRVVESGGSHIAALRSTGLRAACGELVGFFEPGDWADPTMMEELFQAAIFHVADVVQCRYDVFNSSSSNRYAEREDWLWLGKGPRSRELLNRDASARRLASIGRRLHRRAFLEEAGISFPTAIDGFDDLLFQIETLSRARRVAVVTDLLFHQAQNAADLSEAHRMFEAFAYATTQAAMRGDEATRVMLQRAEPLCHALHTFRLDEKVRGRYARRALADLCTKQDGYEAARMFKELLSGDRWVLRTLCLHALGRPAR